MNDETFTEEELAPRLAVTNDLIQLIQSGKARIVKKKDAKPVNGRRMVEIEIELID